MAYSADSFVADEQPTTAKWNKLWSNDASFNDGTGIGTDAVQPASIAAGVIRQYQTATTTTTNQTNSTSTYADITGASVTLTNVEVASLLLIFLHVGTVSNDTSGGDVHIALNIDPPNAAAATDDSLKIFHRAGASSPVDYKNQSLIYPRVVASGEGGTWVIKAQFKTGGSGTVNLNAGVAKTSLTVLELKQ